MTITRSFTNAFNLDDLTEAILQIPNEWGLVNSLGIFKNESVTQNSIVVEKINQSLAVLKDQPRGVRNQTSTDYTRQMFTFGLTHVPYDDFIKPEDVQGKRAYGSDNAETKDAVMIRKLNKMRKSFAQNLEEARCHTLVTGTQWAPNGTYSSDFYSVFGITRFTSAFQFSVATTEILELIEAHIASIQDNALTGDIVGEIVCLASPEWFRALIKHPKVVDAYKFYTSTQEPLRNRLGGKTTKFREFDFGGVRFIEYRGVSAAGTRLIPANEAYFLPASTDGLFETYYGPANKMSLVNTLGEEMYAWTYDSMDDSGIVMQAETNFLNLLRKPQVVTKATMS